MTKIKFFQKDTTKKDIVFGILLVLSFTWLNTFIHQNSFSATYEEFYFVKNLAITALCTGYFFCLKKLVFDDFEIFGDDTRACVVGTAITGILMMLALLLEMGTDSFSIYTQKEIVLGTFIIHKKYVYGVWTIVWFPLHIDKIFARMRQERFRFQSILYSCICIIGLTLEGILLFRPMANIWLIDLVVFNSATLILAVWKYVINDTRLRKGEIVAAILSYVIFSVYLLPLQCNNWGKEFSTFMWGENWNEIKAVIREVVSHASFWGTSGYLRNSASVHSWLLNWNKPILQLLYYGGWISVIVVLLAMVCLLCVLVKMLGIKNGRIHKNWLLYATATVMFFNDVVSGTLYAFGFPCPVGLPFLRETGFTDWMAFALIVFCALENLQIQKNKCPDSAFVLAETLLGKQDSYQIFDEFDEPYREELWYDEVTIIGSGCEISCDAYWCELEGREFCVFKPQDFRIREKRFILEFVEDRWILPDDPENKMKQEICQCYAKVNVLRCMDEEMEDRDEEFDDEDSEFF